MLQGRISVFYFIFIHFYNTINFYRNTAEKIKEEYDEQQNIKLRRDIATQNRERCIKELQKECKETKGVGIQLKGGTSKEFQLYDTDVDKTEFRQESFFMHLFQVNEPDCYGFINQDKKTTHFFIPNIPKDAERWNGVPHSYEYYNTTYGFTSTNNVEKLKDFIEESNIQKIFILNGYNTDSGSNTDIIDMNDILGSTLYNKIIIDKDILHPILCEQRVIKTDLEIILIRRAVQMSAKAHIYVMKNIRPKMYELQCESLFRSYTSYCGGSRHVAYTCICASGENGSILHYGHARYPNDRLQNDGDMIVLDMGGSYCGYSSDLTRSYPVNGKFTDLQKDIYNGVLNSRNHVQSMLCEGVNWCDMHREAEKIIIETLHNIGIQYNGTIEKYMEHYIGSLFMPHGLGHFMGIDVHDVGGYIQGGDKRSTEPGLKWLRTNRILKQGMVITVEPGIYFNKPWILSTIDENPILKQYINLSILQNYWNFGGVRIEDDVLITKNGYEILSNNLPVTIKDIESTININKMNVL